MSTPWEEYEKEKEFEERLEDIEYMAREQEKADATRRWLLFLFTADGAEKIQNWTGSLPHIFQTVLTQPLSLADCENLSLSPPPLNVRSYRLEMMDRKDGTAVYREMLR